jgi:UDP-GlcNAc3NAcA epimerase
MRCCCLQKLRASALQFLAQLNLTPGSYLLATAHRPYNTDVPENLRNLLGAFAATRETVIFPVHPRTRHRIAELDQAFITSAANVKLIDPVSYLDMLMLEKHARMTLTDSGGVQKELTSSACRASPCVRRQSG